MTKASQSQGTEKNRYQVIINCFEYNDCKGDTEEGQRQVIKTALSRPVGNIRDANLLVLVEKKYLNGRFRKDEDEHLFHGREE